MTLFGLYYILLLITFGKQFAAVTGVDDLLKDDEAVAKNERIDKLIWLQSLDRGCVAKPKIEKEIISTMSLEVLNKLVHAAYVELQCSYVYFALLYLHLINIYISNPMYLVVNASVKTLKGLIFAKQSATMLALVHAISDQQWNATRAVMWIFYMFAEKTTQLLQSLIEDDQRNIPVYQSVVWPYEAVNILLEEFTVTMECQAYDQVSGQPDKSAYAETVKNLVIGGRGSASSEIVNVKIRFWMQTVRNARMDLLHRGIKLFSVYNLLLGNALDRVQVTAPLENTFGVQLEWKSVTRMLEFYYSRAKYGIAEASLQESIRALEMFQFQFIRVLKVIAIRIVITHLLQFKNVILTATYPVLPHCMARYKILNKRVADGLQAFADCVCLVDDQHLKIVDDSIKELSGDWVSPKVIGKHVDDMLVLLKDISLPDDGFGVRFDVPVKDNVRIQEQVMNAVFEFARDNGFSKSEDAKNIIVIEVYVEFVKTIADFHIIHSFAQLSITDWFKRVEELETQQQRKQSQRT